jgi:hypothetical protein
MIKLEKIVIWIVKGEKVLLKKQDNNWRPFEAWRKRKESRIGAIRRALEDLETLQIRRVRVREIQREEITFQRNDLFRRFLVIHLKCEITQQLDLSPFLDSFNLFSKEEAEEILPRYYSNIIFELFTSSFFV